jgi:hypothetical protein
MFGLFGDTDVDLTNGRAVGIEVSVDGIAPFIAAAMT